MDAHALAGRAWNWVGALAAGPRGPLVVTAALIVALGWQLAGLTWRRLPSAAPAAPPANPSGAAFAGRQTTGAAEPPAARMAGMHLFGQPPPESEPIITEAPETQLDLSLKGLFVAGDGTASAIIAIGGGPEDVYTVGDTLVGDTTVRAIRADGVIIERGGQPEVLRMASAPTSQ